MEYLHMFKSPKNVVLLLMFSLLWLGCLSLPAKAETAVVNFDVVNVRSGPGTSYLILNKLNNNTTVNILERSNGWLKITSGDLTGWVNESLITPNPLSAQLPPAKVYINRNLISFEESPIYVKGWTMVPISSILMNLDATMIWDKSSQTVTISKSATTMIFTIGSHTSIIKGQMQILDIPVQMVNGQIMVPLRLISETLGYEITWDGENQVIHVNAPLERDEKIPPVITPATEVNGNSMVIPVAEVNVHNLPPALVVKTTTVTISATDVNIRSGPSTAYDVIGLASAGTSLAYVGKQDGWYQVMYRGQSAWVAGWLVTPPATTDFYPNQQELELLPVPSSNYVFIVQMKPYADISSKGTGLPVNFLLAQWAEESGFGTSAIAKYYNNFGGIKDPNTGGFKKYQTAEDFAQDVINLYTQHSNYSQLLAHARAGASTPSLLNDLTACHYARSSNYGQKIKNVYLPEVDAALATL